MKPFWAVAIPHEDVEEGRLNIEVFAADLWDVFKGEGPEEYRDKDLFFRRTHITKGLEKLLQMAEKRLKGEGGDAVVQLQTPFGGGKTHSLIALYHKAKEWGAKVVVISGDKLDPREQTLWEFIEEQLEGKVEKLRGKVSPGGEKIKNLLEKHQPLLLLFDEIHEYTVRASGIPVGDSTLAVQTLSFIQELSTTIRTLDKCSLFISLPSSNPYRDENSERLLSSLQHILGRVEKVYTPVEDQEVAQIIRKRLFKTIKEKDAKDIIEKFLDYAESERILPEGMEKSQYRQSFLNSYPFQPEVIDVLYKRWGSFPEFQRTRGVLRLLALVVHSLIKKKSEVPFIRLSDFDLNNNEIRSEFVKHIGSHYESVIFADITSLNSGARKVDKSLGDSYKHYSFGTKVATTIFLYSFSGGTERGATLNEIKLSCAKLGEPSSIIAGVVHELKSQLFYISETGLFFTNQPNLNRILLTKKENINPRDISKEETELLKKYLGQEPFKVYLMPSNSNDIPDNKDFKLIVLKDETKRKDLFETYGKRPRVYRNTLIFLCPLETERVKFEDFIKEKLAYKAILEDKTLQLTEEQKKKAEEQIKTKASQEREEIRNLYRIVFVPERDNPKIIDLGIPTYGDRRSINEEVFEKLKSEEELSNKLGARLIEMRYLKDKGYAEIKGILEAFYTTPGEIRIVKDDVLKDAIREGVEIGLFGLGIIEGGKPVCKSFKEKADITIEEGWVIISKDLCSPPPKEETSPTPKWQEPKTIEVSSTIAMQSAVYVEKRTADGYERIRLKVDVPVGSLSEVSKAVSMLRDKFKRLNIKVEICAEEGNISRAEYENIVEETIKQVNITIEEEDLS